jgi:hypothetical protein
MPTRSVPNSPPSTPPIPLIETLTTTTNEPAARDEESDAEGPALPPPFSRADAPGEDGHDRAGGSHPDKVTGPSSGSQETYRTAAGVASSAGPRILARLLVLDGHPQPHVGQRPGSTDVAGLTAG